MTAHASPLLFLRDRAPPRRKAVLLQEVKDLRVGLRRRIVSIDAVTGTWDDEVVGSFRRGREQSRLYLGSLIGRDVAVGTTEDEVFLACNNVDWASVLRVWGHLDER